MKWMFYIHHYNGQDGNSLVFGIAAEQLSGNSLVNVPLNEGGTILIKYQF